MKKKQRAWKARTVFALTGVLITAGVTLGIIFAGGALLDALQEKTGADNAAGRTEDASSEENGESTTEARASRDEVIAAIGSGDDDKLKEVLGLKTTGEDFGFDEILSDDIRKNMGSFYASAQALTVGYTLTGSTEEVASYVAEEMEALGWVGVESGTAGEKSFKKDSGSLVYALVSCVSVGNCVSVVVQCSR